jgi:enolase
MGSEVFHTLKKELSAAGHNTASATRAASRPNLPTTRDALDFIMRSVEKAGYKPGDDVPGARLRSDRILQGRQVRL